MREPQELNCKVISSGEKISPTEAKIRMAKLVCMLIELGLKYKHLPEGLSEDR